MCTRLGSPVTLRPLTLYLCLLPVSTASTCSEPRPSPRILCVRFCSGLRAPRNFLYTVRNSHPNLPSVPEVHFVVKFPYPGISGNWNYSGWRLPDTAVKPWRAGGWRSLHSSLLVEQVRAHIFAAYRLKRCPCSDHCPVWLLAELLVKK